MSDELDRPEEEEEEESFPTAWSVCNALLSVECRQLSVDTFELRSPSHTMVIDAEGFNLYRDDSEEGKAAFDHWCVSNGIVVTARADLNV